MIPESLLLKMTKTVRLPGFSLLVLTIILTSCDPMIGYEYYLNNQSDKELKVLYKEQGDSDTTIIRIVSPKTEILFYENEIWGKNPHDEKADFLWMFDTLSITATDSSRLLINYLERDNWNYTNDISHLVLIKTGTNIYQLEILNDDFEDH